MNKPLILVVEDDEPILHFVSSVLSSNGYRFMGARSGREALDTAVSHVPDVILLDLGLPDIDGIEVLKAMRTWSDVPIIIVSARGHEREKVEGLDLGADDYVTKPFGTYELLARIRTAMRHHPGGNAGATSGVYTIGSLTVDNEKRVVSLEGQTVHLTPIEYKILLLLARHAGKVLTHAFILKEVWGPNANENQALRVNMANIRRKLEKNPAEPRYILTEVGVGYRMAEE